MVLLRIRVPPPAAWQVVRFAFVAWSTYFLPYSIQKSRFGSGWEGAVWIHFSRVWQDEATTKRYWLVQIKHCPCGQVRCCRLQAISCTRLRKPTRYFQAK